MEPPAIPGRFNIVEFEDILEQARLDSEHGTV
jgi:hypothetical protein